MVTKNTYCCEKLFIKIKNYVTGQITVLTILFYIYELHHEKRIFWSQTRENDCLFVDKISFISSRHIKVL